MSKTLRRLIAAILMLIVSSVMVVTMTYAWTTLSTTPVAEGIQITIGGGNTILVAADCVQIVDGKTYHYPSYFGNTLNFSSYDEYDYLNNLNALVPVSTSNGQEWFIPTYYNISDNEVANGTASVGQLKPINDFITDKYLEYANLSGGDEVPGHYVYIDFWVVSPGSDYVLRVSKGDNNGGSYLLELNEPIETSDGGFTLAQSDGNIAASARVGFLVNNDYILDDTMAYYVDSYGYSDQYLRLAGNYSEPGDNVFVGSNRFTIYEPNGDMHPNGEDGEYVITNPLCSVGQDISVADVSNILTVQLKNSWKTDVDEGISIEEIFQTALAGKDVSSSEDAKALVYKKYLQGQFVPYINKGDFVQSTRSLYDLCSDDGVADFSEIDAINKSGATDDTFITVLQKNVPQRIRMFIWIEGQDVDCVNNAETLDFALSIELAGGNE